jgi:threonine aldolase
VAPVAHQEQDALAEFQAARDACPRSLAGNSLNRRPLRQWLEEIAAEAGVDEQPDLYGEREVVTGFEAQVAKVLGKEAAVFMPSGTMAQQIALRIWCDRAGVRRVAFHPRCHLEMHEQKAYQVLHGLEGVLVGSPTELITLDALQQIPGRISTLLLELPQREIGGQLPAWNELTREAAWARDRNVRLHLDGARLWEAAPSMGRSLLEVSSLFDSVYVSMYKGLGAVAGAVLCGPDDFIREARLWQQRHGGRLVHIFPLVIAARAALRQRMGRFPLYRERALRLAEALKTVPGLRLVPDPPHAHMMHVYLAGERQTLLRRAAQLMREEGLAPFRWLRAAEVPGYAMTELEVGDDALEVSDSEVSSLFSRLL